MVANSRFTVTPSVWYENAPLSVLESFAAARAVIGSNIGGIPEIIEDGLSGHLVPPGDAQALADRMLTLWREPDTAIAMGERAFEMVKERFSPEKYLRSLVDLYQSLLPGG